MQYRRGRARPGKTRLATGSRQCAECTRARSRRRSAAETASRLPRVAPPTRRRGRVATERSGHRVRPAGRRASVRSGPTGCC